jgi:putative ABC transport system permease protein
MNLILFESLVQGVIGTALGLLVGAGIAYGLVALVGPIFEEFARVQMGTPVFTPVNWIVSIGLGVGLTVLAGVIPARNASRIPPLEALRPDVATPQSLVRRSFIPGLILIVISLAGLLTGDYKLVSLGMIVFIVGLIWLSPALVNPVARLFQRLIALVFAREGRIASGNMTRNPGRAAITASSVMISIAIMLAMLSMLTSIDSLFSGLVDKSLSADFLVMPQSLMIGINNVGAAPELSQKLAAIPGVEAVTSLRMSKARVDASADLQVIGIDPLVFSQIAGLEFTVGDPAQAYNQLAEGRWIILNPIYGGLKNFQVGQELPLETPSGRQVYKVAGIASDFLNAKIATAYISQTNLANDFGEKNDVLLMVNLLAGADSKAVFASLEKIIVGYPAFTAISFTDLRTNLLAVLGQVMYGMYFLLMVLAIPSLLGLINTLAINVIERTREIGLMRAVGATRKQVSRMILAESILLTLLGTVMGILAGLWMGYAIVGAMSLLFHVTYSLPITAILIVTAMGLVIGVVAAWLPSRQAARLKIIEALQYE